jgi:DNA-binding NtrC family response regulator
VRRVGANKARRVDVRIVAATNRSLAQEIDRGRFREDLYYRLAVVTLTLPPLREHAEDLPLLIEHFARELSRGAPPALPERVVEAFLERSWPGNVRELRNAVARALSLGAGTGPERAPAETDPPVSGVEAAPIDLATPLKQGRERVADAYERAYLTEALRSTGGNVSRAADLAGVNRKFIQRAIRRWGLRDTEE